jgi:hypothetical protein
MPADAELGKKIIDDLIKLSEPYGTRIQYRNGIGHVEIETTTSRR